MKPRLALAVLRHPETKAKIRGDWLLWIALVVVLICSVRP